MKFRTQRGFAEALAPIIVGAFVLLLVAVLTQCATERSCESKADLMGVPHEVRGGVCMVKVEGQWLPLDNVRIGGAE